MQDNNDIAILTKVNELAERYGINPCTFIANIRLLPETNHSVLFYEMPPKDARQQQCFFEMLNSIGVDQETSKLTGTAGDIYDSLEEAIRIAPALRVR